MNPKLRSYLSADPQVQDFFDRRVKRAIDEDQALERWAEWELATDPIAQRVKRNRANLTSALGLDAPASTIDVKWDATWKRRAVRPKGGTRYEIYRREADPLFGLSLRDVWPRLTGEDVPNHGRVHCPSPDHNDKWPDCAVATEVWNCMACEAGGSIIDLGGLLYGIKPRGSGFFEIRNRLLAALGMEEAS